MYLTPYFIHCTMKQNVATYYKVYMWNVYHITLRNYLLFLLNLYLDCCAHNCWWFYLDCFSSFFFVFFSFCNSFFLSLPPLSFQPHGSMWHVCFGMMRWLLLCGHWERDACLSPYLVPPPMSPTAKSVGTPSEAGSQDSGDGAVGPRYNLSLPPP